MSLLFEQRIIAMDLDVHKLLLDGTRIWLISRCNLQRLRHGQFQDFSPSTKSRTFGGYQLFQRTQGEKSQISGLLAECTVPSLSWLSLFPCPFPLPFFPHAGSYSLSQISGGNRENPLSAEKKDMNSRTCFRSLQQKCKIYSTATSLSGLWHWAPWNNWKPVPGAFPALLERIVTQVLRSQRGNLARVHVKGRRDTSAALLPKRLH